MDSPIRKITPDDVRGRQTAADITAMVLVAQEVERAECIHPHWPDDPIHGAAIVAEEAGETVRAALDAHYCGADRDAIMMEAIHTAATAVRLIRALAGERMK